MAGGTLVIRPASEENPFAAGSDVMKIHDLLSVYAGKGLLLPRPPEDILEKIKNFHLAEVDGKFAGCAALRNYGGGLYEVRSFAILPEFCGRGLGTEIVTFLVETMRRRREPAKIFSLTYRYNLFLRLGFRIVDKSMFPEKIWSDCVICRKKDCCDETAVLLEVNAADCSKES